MDVEQIKAAIAQLNPVEREKLLASYTHESRVQSARQIGDLLKEHENEEVTRCPACESTNIIGRGYHKSIRKFECKHCGQYFSATTGTALYRIHKKEKWQAYLQCMQDGMTLRQSAKRVGISLQTAFNWRHRVLERLNQVHATQLEGIVEADEMFIMQSEKGNKQLKRRARRRGGKRIGQKAISVLVGTDREGHLIVRNTGPGMLKRPALDKAFSGKIAPGTVFCTDGLSAFRGFAQRENLTHKEIVQWRGRTLKNKAYHIQTVNGIHAQIRTDLARFKGVATKYLQNYLNWSVAKKLLSSRNNHLAFWLGWSFTGAT